MPEDIPMDSHARMTAPVRNAGAWSSQSIKVNLLVSDQETMQEIQKFDEGPQRDAFVLDALRIGVLALRQARGQIDAETVKQEGEKILNSLQHHLQQHQDLLQQRLKVSLKDYFDPESGRLQERLARLLKKDGELEVVLRSQIGQTDSELSKTLAAFMGHDSPLMKQLDPKQTDGLISSLQAVVDEQLTSQREKILQEFSLDCKEGALTRFVNELEQRQGKLSGELHEKIDLAVKEFSLNDENSALSRLVRSVTQAQATISNEFSLNEETSALSRLKTMLEQTQLTIHGQLSLDEETSALSRLKKELLALLKTQQDEAQKFHIEVKGVLEAMKARKETEARSNLHGISFEESVCEFLEREAFKAGDIATRTGEKQGRLKTKVGDMTIELGPESVAAGCLIAVEMKDKQKYRLVDARQEIEQARENRGAQVGLFVFAKSNAPEELSPVYRLASDVFVCWDIDDPQTDLFLCVGMTLAKALCVKQREASTAQQQDRQEMEQAVIQIEKTVTQLSQINTWATTIFNNSEKILKEAEKIRKTVEAQTELLRDRIAAG